MGSNVPPARAAGGTHSSAGGTRAQPNGREAVPGMAVPADLGENRRAPKVERRAWICAALRICGEDPAARRGRQPRGAAPAGPRDIQGSRPSVAGVVSRGGPVPPSPVQPRDIFSVSLWRPVRHEMASLWEQLHVGCGRPARRRRTVAACGAVCPPRRVLPDARRLPHAPAGVALCHAALDSQQGGAFFSGPVKADRTSWWSRPRHGHPSRGGVGLPVAPGPVPAGDPRGRRAPS